MDLSTIYNYEKSDKKVCKCNLIMKSEFGDIIKEYDFLENKKDFGNIIAILCEDRYYKVIYKWNTICITISRSNIAELTIGYEEK